MERGSPARRDSALNGTFETIGGPAAWSADGDGLEVRVGRRTRRIAWTEATTAALVRFPAAGAGLPVGVLPGLGHLRALNRRQAVAYAQLVLARGPSSSRAVRVTVPLDGAGAGLLVGAVRDAMGSRWRGEVPFEAHMAVLGLRRPWWTLPALLLVLAAIGSVALLAMLTGAAVAGGRWGEVPPAAWAGLALWFGLLGALTLAVARR